LAVRLSATTRDLVTALSTCGTCATFRELPLNDLIEEVLFYLGVEDRVRDFDLANRGAF
jgi:hypothetical protein